MAIVPAQNVAEFVEKAQIECRKPMNAEQLDPATYFERPSLGEIQEDWVDPDPDDRGMLSADKIAFYVDRTHMIYPFCPSKLKPSSYRLSLGPLYQVNGKDGVLTPEKPVLKIPPNSIVFVAMAEYLRLPHYIAARFNLAIEFIYRGLLLGTGPQVDPGFQGVLSCPLHNISNQPILVRLGDHIATIDFIKTTGFGIGSRDLLEKIKSEGELHEAVRKEEIKGFQDPSDPSKVYFNQVFDPAGKNRWPRPITGKPYASGQMIISSSIAVLDKTIKNFRKLGIIGGVTVAGFVLTLAMFLGSQFIQVKSDSDELRGRVEQLERAALLNTVPSAPTPTPLPSPSVSASR